MKILSINSLPNGSTGKIMLGIQHQAQLKGHVVYSYFGNWKNANKFKTLNSSTFGFKLDNLLHAVLGKYFGKIGHFSIFSTVDLIIKIHRFNPDIIHLHNIHLWVLNYSYLLRYINYRKIPVVWTLHDCWSFTGLCPYFTLVNCSKWKTGCNNCLQLNRYPYSMKDRTNVDWTIKKELYDKMSNITFVTPSVWLSDLAKQSILKSHSIKVINNGIDLSIFKPSVNNTFRRKNNISDDIFIILGVAFGWEKRKGLDVFLDIRKHLSLDKFLIILVGTDSRIDKLLPEGFLSINKTNNQLELAEIYSAADLFFNPTREENYPTVNLEAIACGTPVMTFDTGGSTEMLNDEVGVVVNDDINDIVPKIKEIESLRYLRSDRCLLKSKDFNMYDRFDEYLKLYDSILTDNRSEA